MAKEDEMKERGNILLRKLDQWLGIPLAYCLGIYQRVRHLSKKRRNAHNAALKNPKKAVIFCFGAIGDLLLSSLIIGVFKEHFKQTELILYLTPANREAGELLDPELSIRCFPPTSFLSLLRSLNRDSPDIIIDTSQWARLGAILAGLANAPLSIGFQTKNQFRHYPYQRTAVHRADRHEKDNFLALAQILVPSAQAEPFVHMPPLRTISKTDNTFFLHMWPAGIHSDIKEWPAPYWEELIQQLLQANYKVVLTGSKKDQSKTTGFLNKFQKIAGSNANISSCAGLYTLAECAALFQSAAAVISVNTGIMHLAALCGALTIGLHGPTNPVRWGPYGKKTYALLAEHPQSAYLNLGFEYPHKAQAIMQTLPVEKVLTVLRQEGLLP